MVQIKHASRLSLLAIISLSNMAVTSCLERSGLTPHFKNWLDISGYAKYNF